LRYLNYCSKDEFTYFLLRHNITFNINFPINKVSIMDKNYHDITKSVSASLATLRTDTPDVMKAFSMLAQAASKDGALDKKTKELIALALGIAAHCDACIGFHVQALIKLGVSRAEFEEMLGMTVYMGGGPSLMYAADALTAFEQMSTQPAAV
jgi:AhpD family alkylhydroperoxidase